MIQIIFASDVVFGAKEGQNIHIIELFNNLSKVAKVCLFVPKPKVIDHNISNTTYVPRLFIPGFGLLSYQISLFLYLYSYCKKIRADAMYVRQSDFTFIPLIISKHFKIPYFVEVNGLITDEMKIVGRSKLKITFTKLSEKLSYKNARKIVTVTTGIKEGLIQIYNVPDEKIVVIGNGANIELFRPISQNETKKRLKLEQDIHYICFVGHLIPWQGIQYLIQAAPDILAVCPNTHFLIIGDGIMKKEWKQDAQKHGVNNQFIFTGRVPYERISLFINASDICVAPFVKKRNMKIGLSPIKIFEYMACEKPIVSTQISNLEFIEQQSAGILVKPEDPDALAEAMIKLLEDEELRKKMGENGRKYVVRNHSWEVIGRKVAEKIMINLDDLAGT